MLPDEIRGDVLDRFPAQARSARPQVPTVDGISCYLVGRISVALGPFACNAQIELVTHKRQIEHGFETAILVIADITRDHAFKLIRGPRRYYVHDACGCVSP